MIRWIASVVGLLVATNIALAQSPIVSDFDHDTTGFRIDGAHQIVQCGDCHNRGQFSGTPLDCEGCHSVGGRVSASPKPSFHMLTTTTCESCHTTYGWLPVRKVDHNEVIGQCASCHNNRVAIGKPVSHIPTTADCEGCHRTTLFSLATFSHVGISSGCVQCHNNRLATGKPPDHIPAPDTCEDCHNTTSFSFTTSNQTQSPIGRYVKARGLALDIQGAAP